MRTSSPGQDDDELADLMIQVAAESQAAFAELYGRTHWQVYSTALRLTRSIDHTADVCQDVYVQVWNQASKFDPSRGTVMAWLATISRRRAVDRIRSLTRASARDLAYAAVHLGADADTVWERVAFNLDVELVRTALSTLPPIQREALELAYVGPTARTHAQIAQVLGLPLGTVKSRIRDGLLQLRAVIAV